LAPTCIFCLVLHLLQQKEKEKGGKKRKEGKKKEEGGRKRGGAPGVDILSSITALLKSVTTSGCGLGEGKNGKRKRERESDVRQP